MAWINLATVGWGSSPTIDCNFQYEKRRNGSAMEYDVWVGVNYSQTSRDFGYPIYCEIKINGTTVSNTTLKNASPRYWSQRYEVYTGWCSVANKTSGSTPLSIRLYSGSGSTRNSTYTYSMGVDPAGSDISVSATELGQTVTVTLTKADASFYDTVGAQCGATTIPIATLSQSTTFTFTPAVTLASENTAGTSVPITVTTWTYADSGGTQLIESKSVTVNVGIPASVIPTAALTISDANGYESTYGDYVQGKSAIAFSITGTPIYSSPISGYAAVIEGATYAQQTGTSGVLQLTGSQTVSATVTDARGRASSADTATYTCLAYQQPYLTSCVIERCDLDGTANEEGHYMGITFTGSVTALNNVNSATWAVRYKVAGSGTWTNVAIPSLDGNYTPTHQEVISAADADAFDVEVTITDDFGTVIAGSGSIPVAYAIMNWKPEGDGMAIGGMNTQTGLQIYMDTEIYGDVDFQGSLSENGTALFPLSLSNGGTGGMSVFSDRYTGSITNTSVTVTKTITVSGAGFVIVSASMSTSGGTYGTHYAKIEKGSTLIAYQGERFDTNQSGQFGANACAVAQVSNGNTLKATLYSSRYQSGNTYEALLNVLAFGCTVSVA